MAKPKHPHSSLIQSLGPRLVRTQFNLSHQRLHAWTVNGVPYTHRAAFAQLAMLHGLSMPSDFLAPPVSEAA